MSDPTQTTDAHLSRTVHLSIATLSRLIWLCEAEGARLQKFAADHAADPSDEDDVADADNDGTFWRAAATMLRGAVAENSGKQTTADVVVLPAVQFAKRERLLDGMAIIIRRMTRVSGAGVLCLVDHDERELAIELLSYLEGVKQYGD
jgi:hypothetical protein